ncbi:peptidase C1B, bleomycin hydrolase [Ascodesmis nigricans]|uniref:Cysteine proteinase 1, mitochondrial n=1 Tax=Ascodesmis nigricans TaxID=341454 RepID=A0A4S2N5S0_9PEZI|nr:peptidase C1B, bleomycin hydrolase [Ascodesmis nigricans]
MGTANTKLTRPPNSSGPPKRLNLDKLAARVSDLTLTDVEADPTTVNIHTLCRWEDELLADPKNRLALGALTTHAATSILTNPTALRNDQHIFNHKLELEGSPVTNQRQSGRCWLFASTNVFRVGMMKKYKLSGFEFSQNYLFFWDKLEKANFFLEQIIDTVDEPLDGRLVQSLLAGPVGDGGQWDMVVNLVEKYGLVPKTVYPDSYNATASRNINWLITAKLREAALKVAKSADSETEKPTEAPAGDVRKYKLKVMQDIYGILALSLGAPPKPEDKFTWTYVDKDNKVHNLQTTPLAFYKDNIGAVSFVESPKLGLYPKGGVGDRFSLVNDPRNPYMRLMTVERLGNVHGARGIQYVNVDMTTLKNAVIAMIKAHIPVFFGCDVGKFSTSAKGIMDTKLFDYELGFNVTLNLDKAQRLQTGESAMTHAMVLSGVHIVDGKPTRWRVENSWGDQSGEKGYMMMTDAWMDEYCYQAVVEPHFVDKEVHEVLKQEPIVLPLWDPMGALA